MEAGEDARATAVRRQRAEVESGGVCCGLNSGCLETDAKVFYIAEIDEQGSS